MWVAFMVDYPNKSMRAESTEAEIDACISEFDCDPADVVKQEFSKLDLAQAQDLLALVVI